MQLVESSRSIRIVDLHADSNTAEPQQRPVKEAAPAALQHRSAMTAKPNGLESSNFVLKNILKARQKAQERPGEAPSII
ncbi:hypothetical protein GUITHDRAFT_101869 [Guillardia theta CCMP2712]|uniref:Uncharacterized protein n=1 Tax=Guillardia theta (strain CCMP2712) TaxID=905079 RepID=L1JWX6_GUITC|nr:hypothetical protein GUITHDRAFT_101869 [Guillardia theta CCMP2712]EKX52715.1 hypothetical protein GUITHDRAFT_101869 [Guillardia theta CCMP2712]|eukprot:XP_005839695.1 hypothetical protein GUITHDRAFT_101869 [Guillardia theta CCMP2712]